MYRILPPFTDAGPPLTGSHTTPAPAVRIVVLMMRGHRWLTGIAVVGALASVIAAGMLWLVATQPDAVAMTLGVWLSATR